MSEADILRLASMAITNSMTSFTVLLSISSAYLVAAYKVGDQLSRVQVIILNSLYTLCSLFFSVLAGSAMGRALEFRSAAVAINSVDLGYEGFGLAALAMVGMCALICFACLKFMWDVRKAGRESTSVGPDRSDLDLTTQER